MNVTSNAVRKKLYNMQYMIGKMIAMLFCAKFVDTIRDYGNTSGAVSV